MADGSDESFFTSLFSFLTDLSEHNNREWFEAHKTKFEETVRAPLFAFVEDFSKELAKISGQYTAVAKANGGSVSRIYRDIRFSKDKSPYKTEMALHFWHKGAKEGCGAPVYYLRIAPGKSLGGGGLWQPDTPTLKKIRDTIVERPKEWQEVLSTGLPVEGEKLKRPPAGYPKDHKFAEYLLFKDFLTSENFSDSQVCSPAFLKDYAALCRRMVPFMRFLTKAVGLRW